MMPPNGMPPQGMQPPVPQSMPGQPGLTAGQMPIDPAMLAQLLMQQGQGMPGQMPPGGQPGMPPQGMPQPPMMGPGGPAGALRRY